MVKERAGRFNLLLLVVTPGQLCGAAAGLVCVPVDAREEEALDAEQQQSCATYFYSEALPRRERGPRLFRGR